MSDHDEACDESREMCNKLFNELASLIPNLKRVKTERWCGLFKEGRKRFVYINHRKTMERLEIWCLGNPTELQSISNLQIIPRKPTSGGFGKDFKSRVFIENDLEIENVCNLLFRISYPLS